MNARNFVISLALSLLGTGLWAQLPPPMNQYAPTPKTLEMIRYGNLPADLNSGTVSYEIPVYTISDSDFTIPVILRYSTQGFKPARQSGEAGLHWSLQAGGMITREIVGVDDFGEYGFYGGISASSDQALYQMTLPINYQGYNTPEAGTYGRETCSDIYHFSFPGHSGSFVINHDGTSFSTFGTSGGKGSYTISYSPTNKSFTIKTGDGYQYRFGQDPTTQTEHTKEKRWYRSAKQTGEEGTVLQSDKIAIVTWLLDRIIAPNGRTVDFVYNSNRSGYDIPQTGDDVLTTFYRKLPDVLDPETGQTDNSYKSACLTYTSYLKRIAVDSVFNQTPPLSVSFSWFRPSDKELTGTELDKYAGLVQPKRHLTQISVYDKGSLIRHSSLGYTQSGTRPLLTSVTTDGYGSYSMSYYTDSSHPLPGILSNALDFWGYYNGQDNTSDISISPMGVYDNLNEYIAQNFMNPDWNYARLGLLRKITYPTGGSTRIVYEANRASTILLRRAQSDGIQPADPEGSGPDGIPFLPVLYSISQMLPTNECGGVRVASMTDSTGVGNKGVRTFSYTTATGASSGIVQQFPRFYSGRMPNGTPIFNPALKFPGSSFDQLPVAYSRVTEHFPDSSYIVTTFSDWVSNPDEYSPYRQEENYGVDPADTLFMNNILREPDSRSYRRGLPLERMTYRSDNTLARNESWTYGDFGSGYSAYVVGSGNCWWSARRFLCDRLPSRLDVTEYPDDGGAAHSEFFVYGYDINNLLNLERHGTDEMTEEVRTVYSGTTTLSGQVYSQMVSDGVVSLPVDREVWRGSQPVSGERTNYAQLGTGHYVPAALYKASVSPGSSSLVYGNPETTFSSYDDLGNPLTILSRDSTPSTLVWATGKRYPVALFRGAQNGLRTVTTQGQLTQTDSQYYNNVTSATKTFTSDVSGSFTLVFNNLKTDGSGITAKLDGTTLALSEMTDLNGIPQYSFPQHGTYTLAAGTHTLVLTGKAASPQPNSPDGTNAVTRIKGTLTIGYQIIGEQMQTVDATEAFYEDFESGSSNTNGYDGSCGRTSTYTRTLPVISGRAYILDWMQKNGSSWEYHRETQSSTTGSLTVSITANSSHPVDNIRFYPEGADATSWMWKGNIGMSAATDGRGITEHYVYDSYGRLTQRKDNDGNPVEGWQYQFFPTSPGDSYIRNQIYTSANAGSYNRTTTFYDGLGNPFQTVRKNASPISGGSTTDLAEWTEYDAKGRPVRNWLPVSVSAGTSHVGINTFQTASQTTYGTGEEPWTKTVYDGTPLDRVRSAKGPGKAWHDAGKGIDTEYLTNRTSGPLACRKYTASLSGNTGLSIQKNGYYPAGELIVVRTTDEDGRVTAVFTDVLGQTLLERRLLTGSATSSSSTWADTYYLYDAMGRLVAVLPPLLSEAVGQSSWSSGSTAAQAKQAALAYQYRYDARNRVIAKKLPGAEWTYYIYDKADRLVLTQDGNRRSEGKWLFRAEDQLGRECLRGILPGTWNAFSDPLASKSILATKSGDYSTLHGYAVSGIGLSGATLLGVNWWDDYGFIGEDTLTPESSCGYDATAQGNTYGVRYTPSAQGLLTGSLTGIVGNAGINEYLWRSLYYDAKGRVVQERASRDGVTDKTSYAYDFPGNVTGRRITHSYGLNTVTTETYTYGYDGWGRPTTTTHQLGSGTGVTLSSKSYDRAGRLVSEARNGGATGLQTEYSYNVRSWLTDLSVGSSGSTFTEKLYYNVARDGATANTYQWGGNIARMDWKTGGEERTYQFGYDLLSRLTGASYTGPSTYRDNFTRTYGYDVNGNVTSHGEKTMGNNWQMASTSYIYDGNHLSTGTYDANGNLTAGLGQTVTYNLLNLPDTVQTSTHTVAYRYGADGTKLKKTAAISGTHIETETQYAGNLIFRILALESILIEGGYIDMTGSTPAYRFYVTDHQGNIRAVTDGTGTVLRTNHYDPYGEEVLPVLTSASTLPTSTAGTDAASRYMYSAKEWDNSVSLYDFSARWYNPAGAVSFTTMDPLCEKYYSISPYGYCAGNPVNLVDPSGAKFTKESKQYVDMYVDEVSKRFSDALTKSIEYEQLLMSENLSKIKRWWYGRKLERQNQIMGEMGAAAMEYLVLEGSSQVYDVSIDHSIAEKYSDNNTTIHGVTVFDAVSSNVQIKMSPFSLATLAHEMKHAFQFECGETAFDVKSGQGASSFHDLNDEKEAFLRGRYFGGESMPWRFYSGLARDNRAVSVGSSPTAVQQRADFFKVILRFNGMTYYGGTKL